MPTASDPYQGLGTAEDPYAGLGAPVDPYEGLGTPDGPGLVTGTANSFRRGVRQAGQSIDAAALAGAAGIAADADREPERVALERQLQPPDPKNWEPGGPGIGGQRGYENARQRWETREAEREERLRNNARAAETVRKEVIPGLVGAIERRQDEIEALPQAPGKEAYDKAEGFTAKLGAALRSPVQVIAGLSAESLPASMPALAAGAAGSVAGPVGTAAGAGFGSFASEVGATILEEIAQTPGVDMKKPETVAAALSDPERLEQIREKAARRGVGVAVFDALSAGIAGRIMRRAAATRLGRVGQGAAEMGVQGAAGGASEIAGSVAAGDAVDWGDVLSEVLGEVGSGTVEIATGVVRDRGQTAPTQLREPEQTPSATTTREEASPAQEARGKTADALAPAPSTTTSDLESEIAAALPDSESRDVLAGRSAEATARELKNVAVDFAATVETVKDALLAADVTPAQLDALDFQLRVLEERKDKRRLKPEQVNASLSSTFLMEALPAADVFPLVSKLAENARNIGALRQGIASLRAPGQLAPVNSKPAAATPIPVTSQVLTPEQRAAKAQALQEREQAATEARRQAEAAQQQQRDRAAQDAKEQKTRIRAESARLDAIEQTGRDPETKRIVDLTRVPDAELDLIDLEAEGVTSAQLEAEMERRARAAERAQATETNRGEELLDVLEEIKLPSSDEALGAEMALLTRENMTPRQRMTLLGSTARGLDATAEALRERGFAWAQTPADVIDAVQRALRGEKIYAASTGEDGPRFRRSTQPTRRPPRELTAEQRRWWENFRILAPAVARQFDLQFGDSNNLVDNGDVDAADLTGDEQAAYLRRRQDAIEGIIYLFDRALRTNTDAVNRLNLQHEMAHAFWDTLPRDTQQALRAQWRQEIGTQRGPLFNDDGTLRDQVAEGVIDDVQEWFAERIAHANDAWAKRRTDTAARGDTLIQTLAAEFRALLVRLREHIERAFARGGYDDALLSDFRKFLDQGTRWNDELTSQPAAAAPAPQFARREAANPEDRKKRYEQLRTEFDRATDDAEKIRAEMKPLWESQDPADETKLRALNDSLTEAEKQTKAIYTQLTEVRRELDQANPAKATIPEGMTAAQVIETGAKADESNRTDEVNQLLRDFASLERTRDRYLDEGNRVPRHVLTGLTELREQLEAALPGWRQMLPPKGTPPASSTTAPESTGPEPEQGATGLFESNATPDPDLTAAKRSQLEASTLPRPKPLRDWLETLAGLFTNFKSAIPELPNGAGGRIFMRFRQGYRMIKAATEYTRKDAEDQVAHVVEPLMKLGREAISPATYRELQQLQRIREEQIKANKPLRPELKAKIAALENELESVPYHLFRKVVLYRDLFFRSRLAGPDGEPLRLPFNLTAPEIESTLSDLHQRLKQSPARAAIEEALRRHYVLVKDVRDGLLARGYIIPEELRNPLYFPHLVLEKTKGGLQRVKVDTAEDFRGYLQQLVGSDRAIESDYMTAMYYHLATVKAHNARQDIVEKYWQPYDIKKKLEADAKEASERNREQGRGPIHWRQLVPDDHVVLTVDDRIPLRPELMISRDVLAQKIGVELADGSIQQQLRELGMSVTLTAEDFQEALAAGQGKLQWVVPKPIADAINGVHARTTRTVGLTERIIAKPQALWKRWTLFAPHTVVRYTYGNLVADLEKLFSADPAVFRQLKPAFREVYAFFKGGQPSADMRAALERGVIDSVTANEVTTMTSDLADRFEVFLTQPEKVWRWAKNAGQLGVTINRYREATFRYAKFKADLDRMRNGAEPVYAGAYNRDVRAIEEETPEATHYARAAEISRRTFGDYQDISVSGDALRRLLMPFYSWTEVNFRYHVNLFRNLADMTAGAGAAQIARQTASAASRVLVARSVTGVLLRLALPYAAVALWNNTGDREELEKTLSEEDRRRFHIILGKDEQGRTMVIYAPTALSDFMRWFGGNDFARLAGEYARDEITFPQLVHEWASNAPGDVVNNVVQGVGPIFKASWTALFRKATFPDFFDQRTIPDYDLKWAVLGNMVDSASADIIRRTLDRDYYASKDFGDWAQQLILQARRRDPEQWGYYATLDKVDEYKAAHAGRSDPGVNNRDDAQILANFRRALRAGDISAGITFYKRALELGYTAERFAASIRRNDPLATISREYRKDFVASLSEAEQLNLQNAYRYAQRMQAFQRRERQLFPSDRATPAYRQRFAAQGGRPDIFAGIMVNFEDQSDEALDMRAEKLLQQSLRPTPRR